MISICAAGGQGVVAILESAGGAVMSDRYAQIVNAPVGSTLAKQLGLPQPVAARALRARRAGARGPVLSGAAAGAAGSAQAASTRALPATGIGGSSGAGAEGTSAKALVFDATGIADSTELVELQRFFYPDVGRLERSGRVDRARHAAGRSRLDPRAATAQRALEGFTRSLGKEIGGRGATAQLVYVAAGAEDQLDSTLRFLLSPRSAYVSGQVVRIGAGVAPAAGDRLGAAAGRQGRAGHRRLARDRRRDRRDAGPRRRHGRRPRRAAAPAEDLRARRRRDRRRRRSSSTSPPPTRRSGSPSASPARRRRRRPQRRRHPRPHDREDARGALERS